tara:strand:+ start:116 stop:547 length:432 start_codon:yes stop_codon:yes gene_type:complete
MKNIVYVNPRNCFGLKVPLRVQGKFAKDLCIEENITFSLPITESWYGSRLNVLNKIFESEDFNLITFSELFLCSQEALQIISKYNTDRKGEDMKIYTTYESKEYSIKSIILYIQSFLRAKEFRCSFEGVFNRAKYTNIKSMNF